MDTIFSTIHMGDLADLQQFIKDDPDSVNEKQRDNSTPLMEAVIENKPEMVRYLLKNDVNIDAQNDIGYTALHFASQNQQDTIVQILLTAKAKIDIEDQHGNTPLARAVFFVKDNPATLKLLLEYGADPDKENNSGVTPRFLALNADNFKYTNLFTK